MLEATAAALFLMRKRRKKILPEELEEDELRHLDVVAEEVNRKLFPVIFQSQQAGIKAGAISMHRPTLFALGSTVGASVLSIKFSQAWRRRVMLAVINGSKNPANEAAGALRSRLDSIAITESARGFNQERQRIAESYRPTGDRVLIKRWDARLDACEFCWSQNGTVVLASESFPGGEPGMAHPRCQCVAHYEEVSRLEYYMLAA
jgi:hypothetical protein